jgi:hypothetical protein
VYLPVLNAPFREPVRPLALPPCILQRPFGIAGDRHGRPPRAPLVFAPQRAAWPKFKHAPSDLEKRQFIKSAFDTIRRGFDSRLHELAAANLGVETDLTPVGATAFTAEIFINGQSRAQCRIWQRGIHSSEGISYAEGSTMRSPTACNEVLTIATGGELALSAMMNMGVGGADNGLDVKNLTPDAAAE